MKKEIEAILSELRASGVSKEICDLIRRNAKAGALEYAKSLLMGDAYGSMARIQE